MQKNCFQPRTANAFTIFDLMAVLAVLVLLTFLALPAFARAKVKSPAAGCLSNLRQLMIGWEMYKEDNSDYLMPNAPVGSSAGWVSSHTESWSSADVNTNFVYFLQSSLMAAYIGNDLRPFHCPADVVPSANGQRLRSISMNGQLGGGFNYNPTWLQYFKGSDLTCPTPASTFVFSDEHPGSINDGYLQLNLNNPNFPDVPANYHDKACGIGFADGHAEEHRWNDALATLPTITGQSTFNVSASASSTDWHWLQAHGGCNHH